MDVSVFETTMDPEEVIAEEFSNASEAGDAIDGVIASSTEQAQALWRFIIREAIPDAHRLEGVSFKHDISVPVSKIPAFLNVVMQKLNGEMPGIRLFAFGHLGDGNIHFNPLQAEGEPQARWRSGLADVNRIAHDTAVELAARSAPSTVLAN